MRDDIPFSLCAFLDIDCLEHINLHIMWIGSIWNGNLYYIACCHHIPKYVYSNVAYCEALSSDVDRINSRNIITAVHFS